MRSKLNAEADGETDGYSVRGSMTDIMNEIREEL